MRHGTVFSLGTSNRTTDEFMALLKARGIRAVVDVRRFPTSRLEQFRRENLERLLASEGIAYHWMGPALGGYRKGGYEVYAATKEFADGVAELEEVARACPTAFVCAERLPWRCHRRHIAAALQARGWDVVHIN